MASKRKTKSPKAHEAKPPQRSPQVPPRPPPAEPHAFRATIQPQDEPRIEVAAYPPDDSKDGGIFVEVGDATVAVLPRDARALRDALDAAVGFAEAPRRPARSRFRG